MQLQLNRWPPPVSGGVHNSLHFLLLTSWLERHMIGRLMGAVLALALAFVLWLISAEATGLWLLFIAMLPVNERHRGRLGG